MIFRDWYFLFLLVLLFVPFFRKKRRVIVNTVFTGTKTLGLRAYLYNILQFLAFLYFTLMVFFLARPQVPDSTNKNYVEGIDIVLVLDISQSMLGEDFKPNRLEVAKKVMMDFIKKRINDKIGIVVFSGEAYTLVPLSIDHRFLLNKIKSLSVNDGSIKQGTAIGVAIATATARLKQSKSKSKIVILLTDGENNTGDIHPISASELANAIGIRVYTIGVGKDARVPYPVYTKFFGKVIKQYQYVMNHLDTRLLKGIASKTGAKFFRASNEDALKSIFKEIDKMEKEKILKTQKQRFKDIFPRYADSLLIFALVFFVLMMTVFRRFP